MEERIRWDEDKPGQKAKGAGKGKCLAKKLVADISLDNAILKDVAQGNL